jgi:thiol-disulfide isomerase/thioredoxin
MRKKYFLRTSNLLVWCLLIVVFGGTLWGIPPQTHAALPPFQIDISALDERKVEEEKNFTLSDVQGTAVRLGDWQGRVVLLNFFATWCPPCREEMPLLEKLYQAYQEQEFIVVGIAGDVQGKKVVAPFIQEFGVTFPVLLDSKNEVLRQYLVRGLPTTFVLDRQGRIAGKVAGGVDWNSEEAHAMIEQLLQESPSP